jgi:uncharacterized protein (TIGR01777 family)
MNILITGATGFLGKHLLPHLQAKGHNVSMLSRKKGSRNSFYWNPAEGEMDSNALTKAECIIHLAGENIGEGRWTAKRKKEILVSRVKSGELLYEQLKKNKHSVHTFISASGVGIYGNTGDVWVDESTSPANDFLAEVCKAWENVASKIASLGIRVVIVRQSTILGKEGGALPVIARPVKLYAGAALGTGQQYMSWIHVEDVCRIYQKAVEDSGMSGVYNAVAPNPRTNAEFTKTLAGVLHRPLWLPNVPAFMLQLVLGEKASIVLEGQRVLGKRLKLTGFQFRFRELSEALKDIYK